MWSAFNLSRELIFFQYNGRARQQIIQKMVHISHTNCYIRLEYLKIRKYNFWCINKSGQIEAHLKQSELNRIDWSLIQRSVLELVYIISILSSVHGLDNQLEILAHLAYHRKIAEPTSLIRCDKQQYIIIWWCQCCDVLMQNKQQIDTKIIPLVC